MSVFHVFYVVQRITRSFSNLKNQINLVWKSRHSGKFNVVAVRKISAMNDKIVLWLLSGFWKQNEIWWKKNLRLKFRSSKCKCSRFITTILLKNIVSRVLLFSEVNPQLKNHSQQAQTDLLEIFFVSHWNS